MRLGTKLLFPLLGVVVAVMVGYGAYSVRVREAWLRAEARRETQAYATALGLALERALQLEAGEVHEIIARVSAEPRIHGIIVYDTLGAVVSVAAPLDASDASTPEMVRTAIAADRPVEIDRHADNGETYALLRPLRDSNGRAIGALEVVEPLTVIASELNRTRQRVMGGTLVLLVLLTAVLLALVRRTIGAPLSRFVEATRAVGSGDLSYRVAAPPAAELAVLAESFNGMAAQLEAARGELLAQAENRVALERALRNAEKMAAVGNLAAGLAHEIASPLNVVAGRAERIARRQQSPEDARELRIIIDQIDRITRIVRNLLDYARVRELRLQPVDVGAVVEAAIEFLEPEFRRADVKLDRSIQDSPTVNADPQLLQQVFTNVLLNALHATAEVPTPRCVTVTAFVTDRGEAAIEIEDTGGGVPDDLKERIFEPFVSTKPSGAGTGLGLAVVRGIIEEHAGRIELEDGRRGALFRIILPASHG